MNTVTEHSGLHSNISFNAIVYNGIDSDSDNEPMNQTNSANEQVNVHCIWQ